MCMSVTKGRGNNYPSIFRIGTYSERRIINKDNEAQIKSLQQWFIHRLYRSSYCIVSVFRNSPTFSITDIANAIENTPIVS